MKKKLLLPVAASLALLTASCDSKLCYCYEPTASGTYESEVYVNSDTPCSSMNHGDYACVENNERMNPGDIAYK